MRGEQPMTESPPRNAARFIPACAGNRHSMAGTGTRTAVHPRMRGEQSHFGVISPDARGSSPHARGTVKERKANFVGLRFIPACAGNSEEFARNVGRKSVHPRMRGEQRPAKPQIPPELGSSPHARGTDSRQALHRREDRFIPACAGNSPRRPPAPDRPAVHPRMRGEQSGWRPLIHNDIHDVKESTNFINV